MEENSINWWRTPPESPDCNPIENLWPELKEYVRREIKPRTKAQLVEGIQVFCATVSSEKCTTYIRHLKKSAAKTNRDERRSYWIIAYTVQVIV